MRLRTAFCLLLAAYCLLSTGCGDDHYHRRVHIETGVVHSYDCIPFGQTPRIVYGWVYDGPRDDCGCGVVWATDENGDRVESMGRWRIEPDPDR